MGCLDESIVSAFVERRLAPALRTPVDEHVDQCASCRELVAVATRAILDSDPAFRPTTSSTLSLRQDRTANAVVAIGERIGRYRITEILGAGGMGVVYGAFDPELQRNIALKLIRPEFAELDVELRVRLVREAQAMARVSHPHVITVFDVGTYDGRLFVAMERIDGPTLTAWQSARTRSIDEILRVFTAAGQGLAAAHAAGLVHRDFKPDNILIGSEARVCVTDFGLARPVCRAHDLDDGPALNVPFVDGELTQAGTVVGTPAYMAPEQMRGLPADARADQFSFCVALFEAIYGVRPFAGKSLAELEYAILTGSRLKPKRRDVPSSVKRALARGLHALPEARFSSMDELLAALTPRRRVARPALGALAVACAAVAVAVTLASATSRKPDRGAMCRAAGDRFASVWNDARRAQVAKVLGGVGPAAQARVTHVIAALDDYARSWAQGHAEACDATHVRGEQSEALLDFRMQCLEQRRKEVDELASVITSDPKLGDRATQALQALPSVEVCADSSTLQRVRTVPRSAGPRLEQARRGLARATVELGALKCPDALAHAAAAAKEARSADDSALAAEATLLTARAQRCLGELVASRGSLVDGSVLAAMAHDDVLLTSVASQAVQIDAQQADFSDAQHWAALAEDAVKRSAGDSRADADRLYALAILEWRQRHFDAAIERHLQVQRALERFRGNEFERLRNVGQLASVLGDMGRFAEAAPLHETVRDGFARLLGPDHYVTLTVDENIALERWEQGDLAVAIRGERRLLEHLDRANLSHFSTAATNYSWMLIEAGRAAEAATWLREALAAAQHIDGGHDEELEFALSGLGACLVAQGQPAKAIAPLERALGLQRGEEMAADRAESSFSLAQALWSTARDRRRAATLAAEATRYWSSHPLGERRRRQLADAERWLQMRGRRT
ncbi:MAG TPA: serine/threonine-protein kinase [Polyangia bacterium]|jgi:tetratricopeptide (TPR) repeat protein